MKYQHHLLHIHIFMLYFVICTYISLVRKKVASCINFLIDSIKYYLHFKIFSIVFVIAYCIKLKQIWYHNNQAKWQKMWIYLLWNQTLRLSQILGTYLHTTHLSLVQKKHRIQTFSFYYKNYHGKYKILFRKETHQKMWCFVI